MQILRRQQPVVLIGVDQKAGTVTIFRGSSFSIQRRAFERKVVTVPLFGPSSTFEVARNARVRRSETVKVTIRPTGRVMRGHLDAQELALLTERVEFNRDVLTASFSV
jgi:hypothetical protein